MTEYYTEPNSTIHGWHLQLPAGIFYVYWICAILYYNTENIAL